MKITLRQWMRVAGAACVFASIIPQLAAAPERWRDEVQQLVTRDKPGAKNEGGTVFVGSSSIRFWKTLEDDFPRARPLNHGFGGSELADSVFYFEQLVAPYQPRAIVVYAGENDIASGGMTPEKVAADFAAFRAKVRAQTPKARLIFISLKPSPSRTPHHAAFMKANSLIAEQCTRDPLCTFLDVVPAMLTAEGTPNATFFGPDRLHMTPAGYALWAKLLAPHLTK